MAFPSAIQTTCESWLGLGKIQGTSLTSTDSNLFCLRYFIGTYSSFNSGSSTNICNSRPKGLPRRDPNRMWLTVREGENPADFLDEYGQ
jgi:hypothetical protein